MSKSSGIVVLGFLTAFLPFLGLPTGWKTVLAVLFGLSIMALGFLARQERAWLKSAHAEEHQTDNRN